MRLRPPGRLRGATGLVLVVAILTALAGSSAHAGHGCLVDQECLACRWAADSVVAASAPPALPALELRGVTAAPASEETAVRPRPPSSSRAPPRA